MSKFIDTWQYDAFLMLGWLGLAGMQTNHALAIVFAFISGLRFMTALDKWDRPERKD